MRQDGVEAWVLETRNTRMEYPFKRGLRVFDLDPYFINFTISASILTGSRGANAEHSSL